MFGPDLSVHGLLGAGLPAPVEDTSVFLNPCVRERLPVGRYLGHLLLPTEGIKVRKGGVRMGCSLWLGAEQKPGSTPTLPSVTCPPPRELGGLGTRPLGREPSAQAEPRGSQDGFGGWRLQSKVRASQDLVGGRSKEKGHSFSLPFPHLSPVPGSPL